MKIQFHIFENQFSIFMKYPGCLFCYKLHLKISINYFFYTFTFLINDNVNYNNNYILSILFFNIGVCSLGTENLILENETLCINNLYPFIL